MAYWEKVVSAVKCGICGVETKDYTITDSIKGLIWCCTWHKKKESKSSEHEA